MASSLPAPSSVPRPSGNRAALDVPQEDDEESGSYEAVQLDGAAERPDFQGSTAPSGQHARPTSLACRHYWGISVTWTRVENPLGSVAKFAPKGENPGATIAMECRPGAMGNARASRSRAVPSGRPSMYTWASIGSASTIKNG